MIGLPGLHRRRHALRLKPVSSPWRFNFVGHKGTLGPDGERLADGRPWKGREVAAMVEDIAGSRAMLLRHDGVERFDVLPLLVATDGAIAAFGHDHRRLRSNIVIDGVEGLAARGWPGGEPYPNMPSIAPIGVRPGPFAAVHSPLDGGGVHA
jgi:hypothetical protein